MLTLNDIKVVAGYETGTSGSRRLTRNKAELCSNKSRIIEVR